MASKAYHKAWWKLNNYKSIGAMHEKRFGGLREQIILRDKEKCSMCGMTRKEHKELFSRDITVNHIDHQSFRSSRFDGILNNDPDNLETLCLRCHGAKDRIKSGRYATYYRSLTI